jgi:hypothetical protein
MNPGFVNALEMLPVPKRISPTPGQAAGDHCVWCGHAATVDLGPRLRITDEGLHRWKPRTCTPCALSNAKEAYDLHRATCARCTKWEHCHDSRALYALAHGRPDGLIREA